MGQWFWMAGACGAAVGAVAFLALVAHEVALREHVLDRRERLEKDRRAREQAAEASSS